MHTKSPYILVVGGAGYIGSHMVLSLQKAGYEPIVLDDLSKGHRHAVRGAKLIEGSMADTRLLEQIFTDYSFAGVMHFASYIEVAESMRYPIKYYQNNVAATLNLLEVMLKHHVKHFIFSSTAAVFGEPVYTPIDEAHPQDPINPYGKSKHMVETILHDLHHSEGLRFAILRYFNAAGADPEGQLGECHEPESHLIPLVLQVAGGQRQQLTVYGRDYPTPDGTCVRDYVHVTDLCAAHLLALEALHENREQVICNLGTGTGFSVQQVIDAACRVTGCDIPIVDGARRPGDPAVLVADASYAKEILKWQPAFPDLETIIRHAWQFMLNNTNNKYCPNADENVRSSHAD
jgi:UDP-glucose 4-epimerase